MVSVFTVEGNIGAGKTTLLSRLAESLQKAVVLFEPVDIWTQTKFVDGKSLFELFYQDKKKYGFSFQLFALLTRLDQLQHAIRTSAPDTIILCDRSYMADAEIFGKMLYEADCLTDVEWAVYKHWFEFNIKNYVPCLKGILYLRAHPSTCMQRIAQRNREGEVGKVDDEYLSAVHKKHEEWLMHRNTQTPPVCVLDGDVDTTDTLASKALMFIQHTLTP